MKIRIVKPIAPIKINTHWVYRTDDTVVIDLGEFWKQHDIDDNEYFLEKFIKERLEEKVNG